MYEYEPYKLPTLDFVGGDQQDLKFTIYDADGNAFDLSGYTATFSVKPYVNQGVGIVISQTMAISGDNAENVYVTLAPSATVNRYGKYVYQITLTHANETIIPGKGIMYISRNIQPTATIAG